MWSEKELYVMKKIASFILAIGILLSLTAFSASADTLTVTINTEKTVEIEFEQYTDITDSILCEEDNFTGTLYLQSAERQTDGTWLAIYSNTALPFDMENINPPEGETSPQIAVHYEKTVENWYENFSDIPEIISYREYSDTYQTWCSGYLYLQSTRRGGSGWYATYKGSLAGSI